MIASIFFNLFLVQLGLSAPADDGTSDFLMNRLPNLVFVVIQVLLLFERFEHSLLDVVSTYFRRLAHA